MFGERATRVVRGLGDGVRVARVVRGPPVCEEVGRVLGDVVGRVERGEAALDGVLAGYAHAVDPIGRCNVFPGGRAVRRVTNRAVEVFFRALFEAAGFACGSKLSRFDLFHAHLFYNRTEGVLGMLFHAKEYPAFDECAFPYELGFCQTGSDVKLMRPGDMKTRSAVWFFGEEGVGLVESDRLPFGTIYESELGDVLADLFYFEARFSPPGNRLARLNRGLHVVEYPAARARSEDVP